MKNICLSAAKHTLQQTQKHRLKVWTHKNRINYVSWVRQFCEEQTWDLYCIIHRLEQNELTSSGQCKKDYRFFDQWCVGKDAFKKVSNISSKYQIFLLCQEKKKKKNCLSNTCRHGLAGTETVFFRDIIPPLKVHYNCKERSWYGLNKQNYKQFILLKFIWKLKYTEKRTLFHLFCAVLSLSGNIFM